VRLVSGRYNFFAAMNDEASSRACARRDVCFCSQISPPCRSREHPRPFLLQARRLCCHGQPPIPRLNQSKSYRPHTPSALACALSLHLDMRLIRPAASVLVAPSTDNIGCSRRVNGWLFISPFNRRERACPRVEAQVNAQACLVQLQPTWLTLSRLFTMKLDFRHCFLILINLAK
jgi:hypothetical protein